MRGASERVIHSRRIDYFMSCVANDTEEFGSGMD